MDILSCSSHVTGANEWNVKFQLRNFQLWINDRDKKIYQIVSIDALFCLMYDCLRAEEFIIGVEYQCIFLIYRWDDFLPDMSFIPNLQAKATAPSFLDLRIMCWFWPADFRNTVHLTTFETLRISKSTCIPILELSKGETFDILLCWLLARNQVLGSSLINDDGDGERDLGTYLEFFEQILGLSFHWTLIHFWIIKTSYKGIHLLILQIIPKIAPWSLTPQISHEIINYLLNFPGYLSKFSSLLQGVRSLSGVRQ